MPFRGERDPSRRRVSALHLLVGRIMAIGLSVGTLVLIFGHDRPLIRSAYQQWQLAVGLVVLACLAEVAYVRLRHGDTTEDLTFFEAVVVAATLLLPAATALGVTMVGLLAASLLLRRPLVKVMFNLGSYATGASLLIVIAQAAGGSANGLGTRTVLGLTAGTMVFAALNLLALASVLSVVEGEKVRDILSSEWQLSAIMAVGNAGVGMLAVEIGVSAPALLPFVALPILTLGHSYRSAVRQADERDRNRWLTELSGVLAGQPDGGLLVPAAETARGLFAAHEARIVLVPGGIVVADEHGGRPCELEPALVGLLDSLVGGDGVQAVPTALLPQGNQRAVATALDLGPSARGMLMVGWADRPTPAWKRMWRTEQLSDAQRSTLGAVATAVANAIRGAEHLRALTEESLKLQAVVNHGTDGVAVLTPLGELLVWSPAMTRLTGVDAAADVARLEGGRLDPLRGEPVTDLLSMLAGAKVPPATLADALPSGQTPGRVAITVRANADETRNLEITVARIAGDTPAGELTVLTARDITEASRLERLKTDFIASVSHELRTPITPIKGYAQLLASRGHLMEPARRLNALHLIEDRADHLSRLVDDLLLASSVGGGENPKITIEPVEIDLRTIVEKSVAGNELLVDRTTTTVPDRAVMVRCDSVRAVQCLSNLLSNAVKYSPPDSPITVAIVEADDSAAVSVTDAGRGIPSAELDRVFERFHRVDDAFTMQTGGSGLGLYIARELARAMGGDITLVSQLGYGSTLTFVLPRPEAVDAARPGSPAHSTNPRVLEEAQR